MGKVLIAWYGRSGTTEKMARLIAEGVRIAGHEADVRDMGDIRCGDEILGYDGYVFGSATYHLELPQPCENFLEAMGSCDLRGKAGGAFSSRAHPSGGEGSVAALIFERMESSFKMRMTNLGPFDLKPQWLDGGKPDMIDRPEGIRACQQYGEAIGEMLTADAGPPAQSL